MKHFLGLCGWSAQEARSAKGNNVTKSGMDNKRYLVWGEQEKDEISARVHVCGKFDCTTHVDFPESDP